ncbi:MAG TPA: CDP-alcohol phosphatidyltransferase family protein [Kineosporiaceae bacterium]|nr:CDP-alcohol phosphatidyltransferase family protein [Kineosporiaceae bacterium]
MEDAGTGTALRDSTVATVMAAVLCVVLAGYSGPALMSAAAAVAGIGLVAAAGATVMSRAGRWSGPADRVTLGRTVLIGGCATIGIMVLAGELPARPWWLLALVVPALALDAVDGIVARRTGTSSAVGARLDMEMDAALLLVLSAVSIRSLGWWVLALGGMRYAFVAAAWFRPHLRGKLEFSQFRRVVAAIQGVTLAVALAPVLPLVIARTAVALALVLLMISFGRDVLTLERAKPGRAKPDQTDLDRTDLDRTDLGKLELGSELGSERGSALVELNASQLVELNRSEWKELRTPVRS